MQEDSLRLTKLSLDAMPVIDHLMESLGLAEILEEKIPHGRSVQALLLLIKSILVRPAALYRLREWASGYEPQVVNGLPGGDDVIGRALDRLFAADRASLLTRCITDAIRLFNLATDEIHNDSTSITFSGAYAHQDAKAAKLKRGHNKDHRPDLKQLVYSLSTTADGTVPVHCNILDGNTSDDRTHWETWVTLRGLLGRSDFVYVADSKLCVKETLAKIDGAQGKFITIVPRTRSEVSSFYDDLFESKVRWEKLLSRPSSRLKGEHDTYEIATNFSQLKEGFRIFWYRSSQKAKRDANARSARIAQAKARLKTLLRKRKGPRTVASVQKAALAILDRYNVRDYLIVSVEAKEVESFKQTRRGRPNRDTKYIKVVSAVPSLSVQEHIENLARAQATDGVFPLTTNTDLSPRDVLLKYKHQPLLEKRHSLMKSVLDVAPVFLKSTARINALVFVYFLAQLIAALLEREMRRAMLASNITSLPVLPEQRHSKHPSAAQILAAFEGTASHQLFNKNKLVKTFLPDLSPLQLTILKLLNIPKNSYSLPR